LTKHQISVDYLSECGEVVVVMSRRKTGIYIFFIENEKEIMDADLSLVEVWKTPSANLENAVFDTVNGCFNNSVSVSHNLKRGEE
jgi:hypothetical protein